jgi:hypothetical protein
MNVGTKTLIPDDAVQKHWTHNCDENAVNGKQNSQAIPSHEALEEIFSNISIVFHFADKRKQFEKPSLF